MPSDLKESFDEGLKQLPTVRDGTAAESGLNFTEFFQNGKRIPLRGQEGMSVDQIEAFERAGYKMSANHKRQVEAHYMRMERKVYTPEEKAMLERYSKNDRDAKSKEQLEQFRSFVAAKAAQSIDKISPSSSK